MSMPRTPGSGSMSEVSHNWPVQHGEPYPLLKLMGLIPALDICSWWGFN